MLFDSELDSSFGKRRNTVKEKHTSRWWQIIKQHWKAIVGTVVIVIVVIVVIALITVFWQPINDVLGKSAIINIAVSSILVSLLVGILISFLWWWFLQRLAPRIEFYPYILKWEAAQGETPSGYKYRIQFWNAGSRDIVDVEIVARLKIKGLRHQQEEEEDQNVSLYSVPLGYDRLPVIVKKKTSDAALKENLDSRSHITRVDVHKIAEIEEYPDFFIEKLENAKDKSSQLKRLDEQEGKKTIVKNLRLKEEEFIAELERHPADIFKRDAHLLEHLLSLGSDAQEMGLEITISGYDKFSGTKKSFRKLYQRKHILVQKKFQKKWQK